MKTFFAITLLALSVTRMASAQNRATASQQPAKAECGTCAQKAAAAVVPVKAAPAQTLPADVANLPKGRIENLLPVGMVIVLGCETCAEHVVQWALAQGSSRQDIDLALRTITAVQKLDCFHQQFGPDVAGRMEKPLTAARRVLDGLDESGKSTHISE